jgi:pilus assembly protein CpaE
MKLILANDIPFLSGLMRLAISDTGYTVIDEVSRSEELLVSVHHQKPDVVIIDIQLPEKEMIRLIEQIMDIDVRIAIVVIAELMEGFGEKIMASGARAYLQKPYTTHDLIDIIRKVAPTIQ